MPSKRANARRAVTTIAASIAIAGLVACADAKPSKPIERAVKSDVKFIKCEVCEHLADAVTQEYAALREETPEKKLTETMVIEKIEKMCDPSAKEGDWIITKDLQEKGSRLRVVDMGKENYGECGKECKTIVKACEDILGPRDTDVGEFLYTSNAGDLRGALREWLCEEETNSCGGKIPPLPSDRPKGEKFKKRDKKDVEMERLMAGMKGMPGMGGAQMFSRDQMMGGMGMGGDDDDDDDDESPFAGAFDSGESKGAVANVAEKLGDLKDKAASTAKNAWNKAKGFLSRSSRAEDEDFTDDFTAEELAREEL